MTQKLAALVMLVATFTPLTAQEATGQRPTAAGIEIDAVFVGRNGEPVRDISRDEIEVWIAGYRVPLEQFIAVTREDQERSRRALVLVLDDITVDPALVPRLRDAAKQMVAGMGAGDEMAIVALSGDATKSTADAAALLRTLDRYGTRASGVLRPDQLGEQVLRTIADISRQLAESGARRRTIVGLGSGWVFDTPLPPPMATTRELGPEWVDAMRAMASANVTLYVIDAGGVGRSRLPSGDSGFARESGGLAFTNTNDLKRAAEQIMAEASSYYILGVSDPPRFRRAPLREVEVKVKRPGVTARARRAIAGAPASPR